MRGKVLFKIILHAVIIPLTSVLLSSIPLMQGVKCSLKKLKLSYDGIIVDGIIMVY